MQRSFHEAAALKKKWASLQQISLVDNAASFPKLDGRRVVRVVDHGVLHGLTTITITDGNREPA